jgi:hypoxanthine phosphoribosyltransferase
MRPHHTNTILFSASDIDARLDALAQEMAVGCRDRHLVIVGILRGSFIFLADLVRKLHAHGVNPQIDFMTLLSRGSGVETTGKVIIRKDITVDVKDTNVVLVDDILDTGRTLNFAVQHLRDKGAANIQACMFLDKPSRREVPIEADFVGFEVDDVFVVGYGLDYDSYYRELPHVAEVVFLDE